MEKKGTNFDCWKSQERYLEHDYIVSMYVLRAVVLSTENLKE